MLYTQQTPELHRAPMNHGSFLSLQSESDEEVTINYFDIRYSNKEVGAMQDCSKLT